MQPINHKILDEYLRYLLTDAPVKGKHRNGYARATIYPMVSELRILVKSREVV